MNNLKPARQSKADGRLAGVRAARRIRIRPRRKPDPAELNVEPHTERGPCELLEKLAVSWPRRAQVKKMELDALSWDDSYDDFKVELLPFHDHPHFLRAEDALKSKVLSCGWLAYNEKTVDIEAKIINTACLDIVQRDLPGLRDGVSREVASGTLVDEAYHILLVARANEVTMARRGLESVPIPQCHLVRQMHACQRPYRDCWQQTIIGFATAIVSEVFISDYLKQLSEAKSIQPFNRLTVMTHRRDELAHAHIFRNLAKKLYASLNEKEQTFFRSVLPLPVRWFANMEFDVWLAMLEHIGFPDALQMIRESREASDENLIKIDYSGVVSLAEELGVLQTQHGVDSFGREGLLD